MNMSIMRANSRYYIFSISFVVLIVTFLFSTVLKNYFNDWNLKDTIIKFTRYSNLEPNFHYVAEAAFQPKDRSSIIYQKLANSVDSPTGEDSYFIASNSYNDIYIGVADGVGGWAERGYDSSAISRELCSSMKALCRAQTELTPKQLLSKGYNKIKSDGIVKVGSTTANVAHLTRNGILNVANLGDSWCGVIRDSKIVFQTKFQTVAFNAPYQLSVIPDFILEEAKKLGSSYIMNIPLDADEYSFQLQKEDIVLLATDGLVDNIEPNDIALFISNRFASKDNSKSIVQSLLNYAEKLSKDPNYESVFAKEFTKMSGQYYVGGKEDDITMIYVQVN
ncbi:hypothetical protein TBLA_0H01920 [Henningerozyma blattae CBS 6284]|uniref:Protein phosphatase n=1 Tax=Henningerozyma blattae (strain ATCC 34711 / CBS 6284 / DSM 70876 / NBRC 10599 / NRRL Y-10934 / UCD 77-7) TaxID=1071380 RepID=I2H7X6_HENB6|nr:hypothetical protein TBLA_0H01920 [Tetrapisispora blattae CBS 6284]CCH62478.1 hypothetical protein TBLA_0H01920 [Tetrapisispora blattae CBS 6284]